MIDKQKELGKQEEELKKEEVESLFKERARVHIEVHGNVQGVFFRDLAKKEADKLGLTGWVKNTDNNSVEIIAEGAKSNLRKLIIAVIESDKQYSCCHLNNAHYLQDKVSCDCGQRQHNPCPIVAIAINRLHNFIHPNFWAEPNYNQFHQN